MKYYIIAGEASGDLHGSNLIKELRLLDAAADIRCWGGDKMEAAGGKLVMHYRQLAFMGFVEVIKNLRTIFKNLSFCKKDITAYQPDVLQSSRGSKSFTIFRHRYGPGRKTG
jgi:lipid-A-disaccharide synthase